MKHLQRALAERGPGIAVIVGVLALWEYVARSMDSTFFPQLSAIATSFRENWLFERVPTDLVPTLTRLFLGFSLSLLIGIAAGMAIGAIPLVRRGVMPVIDFLRSIPASALIPFAIVVFGIGDSGKIFLVVVSATWPILLNVVSATANIDPVTADAASAYRIPLGLRIRKLILPSTTPAILAGARTGLAIALIVVIVSEMFGSVNGLGHFVMLASATFRITDMWSGVVLVGLLGYLLNLAFLRIERRLLRRHGYLTVTSGRA